MPKRPAWPVPLPPTGFGQAVILALIQVGAFGVMSFGTLLGVLMARRLGCVPG